MLIVSKFHDYYDTISAFGVDKLYVYQRTETAIKGTFGKKDSYGRPTWPYDEKYSRTKLGGTTSYVVHKRVIGFCGNMYPVIVVDKTHPNDHKERHCLYSTEKVQAFFQKENVQLKDRYSFWNMRDFSIRSKKSMDNFFSGEEFKELELEFHRYKCPVFIYGRFPDPKSTPERLLQDKEQLILNPKLKDYGFAKVKDPVSAFQDIFMYIGGVLGVGEKPIVKLSDKELAKKRGHGDKYSFRKMPTKNKGKKK